MQSEARHTARRGALLVVLLGCALAVPGGAPASDGVLWQGATPDHGTAFAAGVGRELRIDLEAAVPLGSAVRISADRLPKGAKLERLSDVPARSTFRWRPTRAQMGDWRLVFRARDGSTSAPPLVVLIHVGRTAARSFRLSNVNGVSQNATLLRSVNARARPGNSARIVVR